MLQLRFLLIIITSVSSAGIKLQLYTVKRTDDFILGINDKPHLIKKVHDIPDCCSGKTVFLY